jgi:hypothetical protein
MNKESFFEIIIKEYPFLKEKIEDPDWVSLPHLQVSEISYYANNLITINDFETLCKLFIQINNIAIKADNELYNMIGVSFVENVVFKYEGVVREKIKSVLPPELHSMYDSLRPMFE